MNNQNQLAKSLLELQDNKELLEILLGLKNAISESIKMLSQINETNKQITEDIKLLIEKLPKNE
jgi:hypothetical protein